MIANLLTMTIQIRIRPEGEVEYIRVNYYIKYNYSHKQEWFKELPIDAD
jgi:hypothetical protein